MHVRIFKPAKSAMQSGLAKTGAWVLEFEPQDRSTPDPLMGWNGSADTRRQLEMRFESAEEAVSYAKKHGHTYTVHKPRERRMKIKSYGSNFSTDRLEPWTH